MACNFATKEPNLFAIMSEEFFIEPFSSVTSNKAKSWQPQIKYHLYVKTVVVRGLIIQETEFSGQKTEIMAPRWH